MNEFLSLVEWMAWRLPRELMARQSIQFRKMWGSLRGNAKPLMLSNIFWTIPGSFMGIYLPLYMADQGLSKIEIGTVMSAQLVAQVFGALVGGYLAERFGRLRTVNLVDAFCWPLAYLAFSSATGYLSFMAGSILVGLVMTLSPAWISLYVEGSQPHRRMHLFGLLQVPWFLGTILSSSSGLLVAHLDVERTCRIVFGCATVLTAFSVWLRSRYLVDPRPPRTPFRPSLSDVEVLARSHWTAFRAVIREKRIYLIFFVQILMAMFVVVSSTYTNLYLVDHGGMRMAPAQLALIPLVAGTTVLLATFLLVPLVTIRTIFQWLILGTGLMALNILLYVFGPAGTLWPVITGALAGAVGFGLFNPLLNGYWANLMSDRDRPRILAFTAVAAMLVTMPAPTIAGALFTIHPTGPMWMLVGIYSLICACFFIASKCRVKPS